MSLSFCSFSYFGEFQVEYCVGSNITSCLSGYSAFPYLSYCLIFIRSHIGIIHVFKLYFLFDLKVFLLLYPSFYLHKRLMLEIASDSWVGYIPNVTVTSNYLYGVIVRSSSDFWKTSAVLHDACDVCKLWKSKT